MSTTLDRPICPLMSRVVSGWIILVGCIMSMNVSVPSIPTLRYRHVLRVAVVSISDLCLFTMKYGRVTIRTQLTGFLFSGVRTTFSRLWQWLRMFPLLPTDRPECRCRSNSAAMWQCRDAWASNLIRENSPARRLPVCRMLLQPIKRFAPLCSTGTFIGWFLLMMKAVGLR